MKPINNTIKYFVYARKSSESEDRQVQSIDDQTNRLKELAQNLGLVIKHVYIEAKSAKTPNNRPIFDEMMQRIEDGEANGILCWQINRLSRNPVDSGRISWLLQRRILASIQTIDRQYLPDDNVLLFNVESGSANQFILDLSKNVKRGIQSKLEKGWRPGMAPTGYINDLATHTIIKDEERFNLIRRAWEYMLTGNYTVPQVHNKLNNEWGFLSIKRKRTGNKSLALGGMYSIFGNLFYTGIILHNGQQYEGKHDPMISMDEYTRVQELLGRQGKPRPKEHSFAFTGAVRCAECGCLYTAETKKKLIKKTGKIKEYTYYHCTRKTKRVDCSQKKVISDKNLDLQIEREIDKYTILPEFLHWALEGLNKRNDKEIEDRSKIYEAQSKNLVEMKKELDELIKMRYRQLIDDETYVNEKNNIQSKIIQIKNSLQETETRAEKWLELTEKTFIFATHVRKEFINAKGPKGLELKKAILLALGKTPTIIDQKLTLEANEWFVPIANSYSALEAKYLGLEPTKTPMNKTKTAALEAVIAGWQGRKESNPRHRFWRPTFYH
jgi:site-specific DNA recombinase